MSDVSNARISFGPFVLDPRERRLLRGEAPVDLSGRYLDALLLLARHPGQLVTKDRFMAEVWRGVPVTDEALTQCIRSLRKALGDEAGRPRFIETVPKHGYRFVAGVGEPARITGDAVGARPGVRSLLLLTGAGLVGGAAAGLVGGLGYGLLAANDPPPGVGAISVVLVMTCLCLLIGTIGGLGVGLGVAVGRRIDARRLFPTMVGGALGGLVVGTLGRLIGLDAFSLLIGSRPVAITGGSEGLLVGAIAGAAFWSAQRMAAAGLVAITAMAACFGAIAGLLITAADGQMMAGSLGVLAATQPASPLAPLLAGLPPLARYASAAIEGATFVAALTLAMTLALRGRPAA
ncbi:hypothetical protein GCM10022281_00630 [Sphingomonas rosea]|uniref:OmpR/PhoB-type domain-containing protein n=1 Tax=Sphingomonas rosea TaxID=335605 RepID=A0ABP7TGD1_9SPHN